MNKKMTAAVLMMALAAFGCASSPAPAQNDTAQPDAGQEENKSGSTDKDAASKENEQNTDAAENTDSKQQNTEGTNSSDSTQSEGNTAAAGSQQTPAENGSSAQTSETQAGSAVSMRAAEVAGKFAQAFENEGYTSGKIDFEPTDTGNQEAIFDVEVEGQPVMVYLTASDSASKAQMTFDANCQADEAQGLAVMNEWNSNGNTVRVIRNNMANENFVEVLDTKQSLAIHIEDVLPEQLDPVLQALGSIAYPVSE